MRSARRFKQPELKFLGPGKRNGIALSKTGIAILPGDTWGSAHHAVEAQIGETVSSDVLADLFPRVTGGDQFFLGRGVNAIEAGRHDRR